MNDKEPEELILTEQEKKEGYKIKYCHGNGFVRGCLKPYKEKNWYTPSGCPNCNATFVD